MFIMFMIFFVIRTKFFFLFIQVMNMIVHFLSKLRKYRRIFQSHLKQWFVERFSTCAEICMYLRPFIIRELIVEHFTSEKIIKIYSFFHQHKKVSFKEKWRNIAILVLNYMIDNQIYRSHLIILNCYINSIIELLLLNWTIGFIFFTLILNCTQHLTYFQIIPFFFIFIENWVQGIKILCIFITK